jgi:hypothetical protein
MVLIGGVRSFLEGTPLEFPPDLGDNAAGAASSFSGCVEYSLFHSNSNLLFVCARQFAKFIALVPRPWRSCSTRRITFFEHSLCLLGCGASTGSSVESQAALAVFRSRQVNFVAQDRDHVSASLILLIVFGEAGKFSKMFAIHAMASNILLIATSSTCA